MKLTVKSLKQDQAGRGLAAIDRQAMDELDLDNGDYVVIKDSPKGRAIARVWPGYPEDQGEGVIRIDGDLRQEADVSIDDSVTIEKANVKPAKSISVALPQNLGIRGDISPYVHDRLSGKAVTTGQTVRVPFGFGGFGQMSGQRIPVKIAGSDPDGTVVVTDSTDIQVSEIPTEETAGSAPLDAREVAEELLCDDRIELSQLTFDQGEYELSGMIENVSDETFDGVCVTAVFYGGENSKYHVGWETNGTKRVKPGKRWEFSLTPVFKEEIERAVTSFDLEVSVEGDDPPE